MSISSFRYLLTSRWEPTARQGRVCGAQPNNKKSSMPEPNTDNLDRVFQIESRVVEYLSRVFIRRMVLPSPLSSTVLLIHSTTDSDHVVAERSYHATSWPITRNESRTLRLTTLPLFASVVWKPTFHGTVLYFHTVDPYQIV